MCISSFENFVNSARNFFLWHIINEKLIVKTPLKPNKDIFSTYFVYNIVVVWMGPTVLNDSAIVIN